VSDGDVHQLVRAIARNTTARPPLVQHHLLHALQDLHHPRDVTYAPDLTLPAVKLKELTSGSGFHAARLPRRPVRGDQAGWGRRQTSLL
jgi:hypothetical protein